jgi:glycosyltransferase involved in cell wall biosynthesis
VADYAVRLAEALRPHCRIVPDAAGAGPQLYHIGNNQLHAAIYRKALARPGVVLLHDANLHHFYLGSLTREEYIDEFVWQYGEWQRGLAEHLWRQRARSAADPMYFQYAMLRRVATSARKVIVHNEAAAARVRAEAPGTPVAVIPHFVEPREMPDAAEVARVREQLGVGPRCLLLGVFGYLREPKRLSQILRAFRQARCAAPRLRLLVAGEFVSEAYRLAVEPMLNDSGVIRRPHLPGPALWKHICAADVCVNLRYPSSAESSGIAALAMAARKALVVTQGAEPAELPAGSLLAADPDAAEELQLTVYFQALADVPYLASTLGGALHRHAIASRSPQRIARALLHEVENTNFI